MTPTFPTEETIAADICAFLKDQVLAESLDVDENTVLEDLGVDSFSLMEILLFVERRFSIAMSLDKLTPKSVRNAKTLAQAVAASQRDNT